MVRRPRLLLTAVLAFAIASGAAAAPAGAAKAPPFVPINKKIIKVPKGVQVGFPVYTKDGRHIVFTDVADSPPETNMWIVGSNGRKPRCIDCGFSDQPTGPYRDGIPFPDKKRLLLESGLGRNGGVDSGPEADAQILECAPSLLNCASHRYLPIDMSSSKGPVPLLYRRTWHLAPDGNHISFTNVRFDGLQMILARLERQADRYVASNPRIVNPPLPTSPTDTSADRWENASVLWEFKSFSPDGRSILVVGEPNNNVDVLRVNLATGRTTRLTEHPDWDEDSTLSPDGRWLADNSWRTRDRLELLSWLPQIRGFTALAGAAGLAQYYVSTYEGFQCDLSPWLLPARGDAGGRLIGQPLDVYGGNFTAANNAILGHWNWHPDSNKILLQEALRPRPTNPDQVRLSPNRIAIAALDIPATKPVRSGSSAVGSWAPPAATFVGLNANRTVTVNGEAGGTATITYTGMLASGGVSVTYDRFTDDGRTFVDGTQSSSGPVPWRLEADIRVSGANTGFMKLDLTINASDDPGSPLPIKAGTAEAVYNGKAAPPLPELGPCYRDLPKRSRLRLKLRRAGNHVEANVTANIDGDVRPVLNARVRSGSVRARTNRRGRATLRFVGKGKRTVTARAGDTFIRARASIR